MPNAWQFISMFLNFFRSFHKNNLVHSYIWNVFDPIKIKYRTKFHKRDVFLFEFIIKISLPSVYTTPNWIETFSFDILWFCVLFLRNTHNTKTVLFFKISKISDANIVPCHSKNGYYARIYTHILHTFFYGYKWRNVYGAIIIPFEEIVCKFGSSINEIDKILEQTLIVWFEMATFCFFLFSFIFSWIFFHLTECWRQCNNLKYHEWFSFYEFFPLQSMK